jgi:DNA-binding CsgD family transcriptional regulator
MRFDGGGGSNGSGGINGRSGGRNNGDTLTGREREVLALVAQGRRNAEIARELCISGATVENHLHNIFSKIGCSTRTEAAVYALRLVAASAGEGKMKESLQDRPARDR